MTKNHDAPSAARRSRLSRRMTALLLTVICLALCSLNPALARQKDDKAGEAQSVQQQEASLLGRAKELESQGQYAAAALLVSKVLELREATYGAKHLKVAETCIYLCRLYRLAGNCQQAEKYFDRAYSIEVELNVDDFDPIFADTLSEVVGCLPDDFETAKILKSTAYIYVITQEPEKVEKAKPLIARALPLLEKYVEPESEPIADMFLMKGITEANGLKPDYQQAQAHLTKALAMYTKPLGSIKDEFRADEYVDERVASHVFDTVSWLSRVFKAQGDLKIAEACDNYLKKIRQDYSQTNIYMLDNSSRTFSNDIVAIYLAMMIPTGMIYSVSAQIFEYVGDDQRAFRLRLQLETVVERYTAFKATVYSQGFRKSYHEELFDDFGIKDELDSIISLNARAKTEDIERTKLAMTSILRRKGRGQDIITGHLRAMQSSNRPQDRELLKHYLSALSKLSADLITAEDLITPAGYDEYTEEEISSDVKNITRIERAFGKIAQWDMNENVQRDFVRLENVQKAIPADAALVEFALYRPVQDVKKQTFGPARYVAYALQKEGAPRWADLGPADEVNHLVKDFRTSISNESLNVKQIGRALDKLVMQPVRGLVGDKRHILISPDGDLNLLPFAALVDEKDRFLAETYSLTYLTSGRDLLRLKPTAAGRAAPVVVAGPKFSIPEKVLAKKKKREEEERRTLEAIEAVAAMSEPPDAKRPATRGKRAEKAGTSTPAKKKPPVASSISADPLPVASTVVADPPPPAARAGVKGMRFTELEGAAQEAGQIKLILRDARVLTGTAATEESVKAVAGPAILHIATHGYFLAGGDRQSNVGSQGGAPGPDKRYLSALLRPLISSGIVLAGANDSALEAPVRRVLIAEVTRTELVPSEVDGAVDEADDDVSYYSDEPVEDDGFLTALEVSGLNLVGTKLVVLSACDTGLGEVKNGDGVYGLRRALALAGSESQMMSLWKISDAATSDLMAEYYKRLQAGEGRTEALRQVQLAMIRGDKPAQGSTAAAATRAAAPTKDRSHPFYWASFIQSGDWRNMKGEEVRPK
jgi:CHAT domain-containing protein